MKKLGLFVLLAGAFCPLYTHAADPLAQQVTQVVQTAKVQQVFGTVEAVWQFKERFPLKTAHPRQIVSYSRTRTVGVASADGVFFRFTSNFKPGMGGQNPQLIELYFTTDEGKKFKLVPQPVELRKQWVYAAIESAQ